jgi:hypothetical protein
MSTRLKDVGEDAAVKVGLSFLFLGVAPVLWVLLSLLIALFGPAHGIFEWMHKVWDIWSETTEIQQGFQEGSILAELRSGYTAVFYIGVIVLSLWLAISALCLISKVVGRTLASAVEATAAAIWLIPYWTYRVVASVMLIVTNISMLVGFCLGVVQNFSTKSFIAAIFDSLIGLGFLGAIAVAVNAGFIATLSPLYVCLRYVVPLGFICGQSDGIASRRLKSAFAEGNHFPFVGF